MQPRSDLIQQFSSFLRFEGDRAQSWIRDPKLRRSMEKARAQQASDPGHREAIDGEAVDEEAVDGEAVDALPIGPSETSELLWALYWHRCWQKTAQRSADPLPKAHLSTAHLTAYLQEACFWAAYKISSKMRQAGKLSDLFQEAIARTPKVLKGFNPQVSNSLRRYGEFSFSNLIRDHLRQVREMDACTGWSLLHRISRKRLIEALNQAGIIGALQQQYLLAWSCYCEVHIPQKNAARKLEKPTAPEWEKVIGAYAHSRQDSGAASSPVPTVKEIEAWLLSAVKAIRAYQTPGAVSLDAPLGGDQESGSFYDVLPSENESLMDQWVAEEEVEARQAQYRDLGSVLDGAIAQLKSDEQALLQAYYGEQLRQQQIAEKLGLKQYSISRKLSRSRQKLLKAIVAWSETMMHKAPDPSVLDSMGSSLEDWLVQHYQSD